MFSRAGLYVQTESYATLGNFLKKTSDSAFSASLLHPLQLLRGWGTTIGWRVEKKSSMKYNSLLFIPYGGSTFLPTPLLLLFVINFPTVICVNHISSCSNSLIPTDGSTYSRNLNLVIQDLYNNAPKCSPGFNTSSRGRSSNKVYGLLQCFGSVSPLNCANCVMEANKTIQNVCTNKISGLIWLDDCFLRYDNSNFISILDANGANCVGQVEPGSGVWGDFKPTVISLLSNLSNKAYIPANKGFAAGSVYFYFTGKIYGLVQCWEDISIPDCETCLVKARAEMEDIYPTYLGARVVYGSCIIRYEIYPFFVSAQEPSTSPEGSSIPFLPPTAPFSPNKVNVISLTTTKKKYSKALLISLGLLGGIILVLICLIVSGKLIKSDIFWIATHNQERHGFSPESRLPMQERQLVFSLEELVEATENFHDSKMLGKGGFGAVYKGTIRDGSNIAVKKLFVKSIQENEFLNEAKLMVNVQHRNLARLLGCCMEGNERLLVFEYFSNKSLDTFLFDTKKCGELDWQQPHNIIIGIARGLLYLHEDSQIRIIHRDIKASNILLDDKLNPKIADFGLARLFPEDETHISTRAAGTFGYMDPEYVSKGQLTVKVDVYSFGVVLLEIISGRKRSDNHLPYDMQHIAEWAWKLFKVGNPLDMVDSKAPEVDEEQAMRCIHVGLLCVQSDAKLRPTMSDVIRMISSKSENLPKPLKPASNSKSKSSSGIEENEKGRTSEKSVTSSFSFHC